MCFHSSGAALYELFAVNGSWFFTMELVHGRNFLDDVRFGGNELLVQNAARQARIRIRDPQPLTSPEQFARRRMS